MSFYTTLVIDNLFLSVAFASSFPLVFIAFSFPLLEDQDGLKVIEMKRYGYLHSICVFKIFGTILDIMHAEQEALHGRRRKLRYYDFSFSQKMYR